MPGLQLQPDKLDEVVVEKEEKDPRGMEVVVVVGVAELHCLTPNAPQVMDQPRHWPRPAGSPSS